MKLGDRFNGTSGWEMDAHPAHPIMTHTIQFHFMVRGNETVREQGVFLVVAWHLD